MSLRSKPGFYLTNTFKAVSHIAPSLLDPVFKKRGFYNTRLIHEWATIVGFQWASSTLPEKLVSGRGSLEGGTLYIRTSSGAAFLIRHIEPQIIERINTYFGCAMVSRLRFIHDTRMFDMPYMDINPPHTPITSPTPLEESQDLEELAEPLREALLNLRKALTQGREEK